MKRQPRPSASSINCLISRSQAWRSGVEQTVAVLAECPHSSQSRITSTLSIVHGSLILTALQVVSELSQLPVTAQNSKVPFGFEETSGEPQLALRFICEMAYTPHVAPDRRKS